MGSWIDQLTSTRTVRAVELAAQFAESRQRILAENIANIDTPGFVTRQVDAKAFQRSLSDALADSRAAGSQDVPLRRTAQTRLDSRGRLRITPGSEPASNTLFHDGTNARLEQLVADAASNALAFEQAAALLRGAYEQMLTAIRGRSQ